MKVLLDGDLFWPRFKSDHRFEMQIDDLLSHLAEFWAVLLVQQSYPLGLNPRRPTLLEQLAEERWTEATEAQIEAEALEVEAFADAHDLSRCFGGSFGLPPFWLMHSRAQMVVDNGEQHLLLPFGAVVEALRQAGDMIAAKLKEQSSERWRRLIQAWDERDRVDGDVLLALSTGLNEAVSGEFIATGLLTAPSTIGEAANDDDEVRIAARMAGPLPTSQVRKILEVVRGVPAGDPGPLAGIAHAVRGEVDRGFGACRPFEQGNAAAAILRRLIGVDPLVALDIFALVKQTQVAMRFEVLRPDALDALAVLGPRRGPAIIINEDSWRHAQRFGFDKDGAVRITTAHELCHLVLDSSHTVSVVDVLNSRMPLWIEQRARAFAASLLLPPAAAEAFWLQAGRPVADEELEVVLSHLCVQFKVTRSAASWQLEHGLTDRSEYILVRRALAALVPHR